MRKVSAIVVLGAAVCVSASAQSKRSLAVDQFDFSTVQTAVSAVFGTNVDVGKGIQSLMVKRSVIALQEAAIRIATIAGMVAQRDATGYLGG